MTHSIGKKYQPSAFQLTLGADEILCVTADGQFVWNPDADRMIEESDFSSSPALPHILRALRKRVWVGLNDEEISDIAINNPPMVHEFARAIEAKLKEKNHE